MTARDEVPEAWRPGVVVETGGTTAGRLALDLASMSRPMSVIVTTFLARPFVGTGTTSTAPIPSSVTRVLRVSASRNFRVMSP